ncbi:MAG TPA: hypothetical protein VGK84_12365, partial [Candidatus Tumulicola sp.]
MLHVHRVGRAFASPIAATLAALTGCSGLGTVPGIRPRPLAAPNLSSAAAAPRPFLNCPYPSGDVYQTNISGTAPDTNSAAYITAVVAGGGNSGFQAWVNTQDINQATNSTPLVTVEAGDSYESPHSPVPWASNFSIEKDG